MELRDELALVLRLVGLGVPLAFLPGALRGTAGEPAAPGRGRALEVALGLAALLSVLPFFALAFFAQPFADDWIFAALGRDMGPVGAWMRLEREGGRYGIQGLLVTAGLTEPTRFVKVAAFTTVGMLVAAATVVVTVVVPRGAPLGRRPLLVAVLAAILLNGLESPVEGVFWATGALDYVMPVGLAASCFALLSALARDAIPGSRGRIAAWALALSIAAVLPGFTETLWTPFLGACGVAALDARLRRERGGRVWAVGAAAALAGVALAVLAPGNAYRMKLHHAGQVGPTLAAATFGPLHALPRWIAHPSLSLGLLASAPTLGSSGGRPVPRVVFASALLVWLASISAIFAGVMWGVGNPPPPRAMDLGWIVAALGVFVLAALAVRAWPRVATCFAAVPRFAVVVAGGLLAASFAAGECGHAILDLRLAPAYARSLDNRYAAIRAAAPGPAVVPTLDAGETPWTLSMGEPGDVSDWRNKGMARWFGVASVREVVPVPRR
jgi:hypothetical protein